MISSHVRSFHQKDSVLMLAYYPWMSDQLHIFMTRVKLQIFSWHIWPGICLLCPFRSQQKIDVLHTCSWKEQVSSFCKVTFLGGICFLSCVHNFFSTNCVPFRWTSCVFNLSSQLWINWFILPFPHLLGILIV